MGSKGHMGNKEIPARTINAWILTEQWCDRCNKKFSVEEGEVKEQYYRWQFEPDVFDLDLSRTFDVCQDCNRVLLAQFGMSFEQILEEDND